MAVAPFHPDLEGEPFSLQVTAGVRDVRVHLRGALDIASAGDLRQCGVALRGTTGPVLLDLGDLSFLDSTGITALVSFKGELDLQLRQLSVDRIRPETLDLLRMVGVDELLALG